MRRLTTVYLVGRDDRVVACSQPSNPASPSPARSAQVSATGLFGVLASPAETRVEAHVAKSQFGPAAAKLLLPVGSERDRRMATADGVLPAVQKLSPLLRKVAPEISCSHCVFTRISTNKRRAL